MSRLSLLLVCLALALARAASAPPALESSVYDTTSTKQVSIWSIARRFFGSRERIKAKLTGAPGATAMPKDFGLGYKQMLEWHCAKLENKLKPLCAKPNPDKATLNTKPPNSESVAAVKAYCAEATHKGKPLCLASKLRKGTPAATTTARLDAAAAGAQQAAAAMPMAPVAATSAAAAESGASAAEAAAGATKVKGAKKAASKAKKAAKVPKA